ncbi:hypothetical protein B484DRAFT_390342 [Ochromonadaceae sp. CCMP2298]|nr:hypothetical protein B484DRAFT_390342 [Ochromonadaceae sp. CCMP2298]
MEGSPEAAEAAEDAKVLSPRVIVLKLGELAVAEGKHEPPPEHDLQRSGGLVELMETEQPQLHSGIQALALVAVAGGRSSVYGMHNVKPSKTVVSLRVDGGFSELGFRDVPPPRSR